MLCGNGAAAIFGPHLTRCKMSVRRVKPETPFDRQAGNERWDVTGMRLGQRTGTTSEWCVGDTVCKDRAAVTIFAPVPFSHRIALDSQKGKLAADPEKAEEIRQHLEREPGWGSWDCGACECKRVSRTAR